MIKVTELSFKYGIEPIYNNLNIRILKGEHIVLVGPNGSGKTTFLKLLAKELIPDKGDVLYEYPIKVGYLDQYITLDPNIKVSTYLNEIFNDLFVKELEMIDYYEKIALGNLKDYEIENYLNYAESIQDYLLENNFYQIKSTISNIINGLGLTLDVLNKQIKHLSSGMRSKIILGKLLLENNDLILLDEPTNFLDTEHIKWLEEFLNGYDSAFLVVSHSESFLSNIAKVVFDLNGTSLTRYKGSYQTYLSEKEVRNREYDKEYIKQQKYIKETKDFIEKNITRASTSKRAKSRRKELNKVRELSKRHNDVTYTFDFPIKLRTGKEVLKVTDLEIGYNNKSLIEPISFEIRNEDKVVITGLNGVGKSTLINTIIGNLDKINGDFFWDKNVKINFLGQDDFYLTEETAFQVVNNEYFDFDRSKIYNLLATFGINFEMANRKINTLSGGEQMKIKLALMKNNYGNVLILDEPTNHLDFNAKEALKEALINYEGTLILVSHDTDFYEKICDYEITLF